MGEFTTANYRRPLSGAIFTYNVLLMLMILADCSCFPKLGIFMVLTFRLKTNEPTPSEKLEWTTYDQRLSLPSGPFAVRFWHWFGFTHHRKAGCERPLPTFSASRAIFHAVWAALAGVPTCCKMLGIARRTCRGVSGRFWLSQGRSTAKPR